MDIKKILILGTARSGSTRLMEWISYELGFKMIDEPFNKGNVSDINLNNIVVKELINHIGNEYIKEFADKFDIVITLYRKNTFECSVSLQHSIENGNEHIPYHVTNEWIENRLEKIKKLQLGYDDINRDVQQINSSLCVTYEGVYIDRYDIQHICNLLSIKNPKFLGMLGKNYKLRDNLRKLI